MVTAQLCNSLPREALLYHCQYSVDWRRWRSSGGPSFPEGREVGGTSGNLRERGYIILCYLFIVLYSRLICLLLLATLRHPLGCSSEVLKSGSSLANFLGTFSFCSLASPQSPSPMKIRIKIHPSCRQQTSFASLFFKVCLRCTMKANKASTYRVLVFFPSFVGARHSPGRGQTKHLTH